MKHQALFSLKNKSIKIKCRLLQILYGALRVHILANSGDTKQCVTMCNLLSAATGQFS